MKESQPRSLWPEDCAVCSVNASCQDISATINTLRSQISQHFKVLVFQNDHIASKFHHVLSLKIAENEKPAKILNQEWLKSQKRPRKWFIDDLQFENESLSCFLHTRWRQIGLGRSCRELSAFESRVEGRQQPLKTSQKSFKTNKNRYRSAFFFFSPLGWWSNLSYPQILRLHEGISDFIYLHRCYFF